MFKLNNRELIYETFTNKWKLITIKISKLLYIGISDLKVTITNLNIRGSLKCLHETEVISSINGHKLGKVHNRVKM